jgi:hypothetical protein
MNDAKRSEIIINISRNITSPFFNIFPALKDEDFHILKPQHRAAA